MRQAIRYALLVTGLAGAAQGQEGPPMRDPGSVPLPEGVEAALRLGVSGVIDRFGTEYDRMAATGRVPVVGPGATLEIRAAADRARVYLAYTQFDLDGDAVVTRAEYDRHADLTWGRGLAAGEAAILDEEWYRADGDGDGRVTLGELQVLALAMFPVPEVGPLGREAQAMLLMDLDNDGFVDWAEVEAVLESRR